MVMRKIKRRKKEKGEIINGEVWIVRIGMKMIEKIEISIKKEEMMVFNKNDKENINELKKSKLGMKIRIGRIKKIEWSLRKNDLGIMKLEKRR